MDVLVCPHCGSHRIVQTKVPKDVVVVLPCPTCHELVVLFRSKIIPLSREVLEHGTFEEKKMHIAGIIAEFLEPGMFPLQMGEHLQSELDDPTEEGDEASSFSVEEDSDSQRVAPIGQSEVDQFVKVDLKRIDEAAYFRRHFG